jgi:hypothetical protein
MPFPAPAPWLVAAGGITLFTLLALQLLIGYRKIKFRGPLHSKVHKYLAWAMLAAAVVHGFAGLMFLGIIPSAH